MDASSKLSLVVPFSLLLVLLISICAVQSLCCFDRIFSFGDSNTDAGNSCHIQGGTCPMPPYGETYFHKPNDRWCDGRLIVDFIAQAYELALLPPSKAGNTPEYFQHGANFAVAAATALNHSAYLSLTGFRLSGEDNSLGIQVQSLKNLLPIISQGSNVTDVMTSSLFLVGEIGGVDYIFGGLFRNKTVEEMKTWVPYVVAAISSAVNDLINLGATTLVVPGNYAFGCAPWLLTGLKSDNSSDYDNLGCIKRANEISFYHNTMLMEELAKQRLLHPLTKIVYADYYGAQSQLLLNAKTLGFSAPLSACCGAPGQPYNFSTRIPCGAKGSQSSDPAKYISWDGDHLTEAANHIIANGILNGPYAFPPL